MDPIDVDTHRAPIKGEWLEICISPPDPMQFHDEVHFDNRLLHFREFWKHRIKKHIDGYADYIVYIEQSLNGRLHLHGICKIAHTNKMLNSLYKIRMGKPTKKDKFPQYVNMAIYRIKDDKHLKERMNYISKDTKNFEQGSNIIAPNNGSLKPPA